MKIHHIPAGLRLTFPVLAAALCGCNDDLTLPGQETAGTSADITFAVVPNQDWTVTGRGGERRSLATPDGIIAMDGTVGGDTLYLHAEVSDYSVLYGGGGQPVSRGQLVSDDPAGFMYDEIEIAAYHYDDDRTWDWDGWSSDAEPNFFVDETAMKADGSMSFAFANVRHWPHGGKVRFLAYAPSVSQSANIREQLDQVNAPRNYWFDKTNQSVTDWTGTTHKYGPRMYMCIPNDAKDQQDVVVAFTGEVACAGTHAPVKLNFQHPLTGIRFVCADDMIECTVKKITFRNVCRDGNFYLGMYDTDALSGDDVAGYPDSPNSRYDVWANLDDFTMTFDGGGLAVGPGSSITSDDNMFFMLPQKFDPALYYYDGKDVTLEIEFEHINVDTGQPVTETISTSMMGHEWPAGKVVTYRLSFKDQILEVGKPKEFSYLGYVYGGGAEGSLTDTVAVNSLNSGYYRDWNFRILDGADSWLGAARSDDGRSLVFSIKDRNSRATIPLDIDANLKKSTHGTKSSPWNLSNPTGAKGIVTTANCYMVDGAGSYVFPLVYGNAIENGAKNQDSYYMAGAQLASFKGHLGNDLWSPYIQSTWKTPAKAYVLWQDAQGLVADVSLVDSYYGTDASFSSSINIYGVRFDVPAGTIKQGNAVIAVEDSEGNIMWSWHIWVTNFDFSSAVPGYATTVSVENAADKSYTFMPVNLGWCSDGAAVDYYDTRKARVEFTSGTLKDTVTVVQNPHVSFPRGSQPYYQWGRKDPFVGSADGVHSKTWWDSAGTAHSGQTDLPVFASPATTRDELVDMITHPSTWHIPPYVDPGTIKWGGVVDKKDARDETYNNLWNNGVASGTDIKTIYDPCPPGYMVSNADAFTGIQIIDYGTSNAELAEAYSVSGELMILTFPLTGYRDWADNGMVWSFSDGARGCVWSNAYKPDAESMAFNNSRGCAYYMNFTFSTLIPEDFYYTCDGFPVRPYLK